MATYTEGDRYSVETAADLSQKQYHIVKTDSNGKLVLASAATDNILGVIDDGGRKLGDTADVVLINGGGTFKVKLGAGVSKDALLTADSNGQAVSTTSEDAKVFGRALAAGNSGDVIEYLKMNDVIPPAS